MTTTKNRSQTIGSCGHPAKTKHQLCDECRRERRRASWIRYYNRERRVNWLSEINKYEAAHDNTN